MAEIVIRIKDIEGGKVACVATPNVAEMINLTQHAAGITPAQAYALAALRHIREISRDQGPIKLLDPRRKRIITG